MKKCMKVPTNIEQKDPILLTEDGVPVYTLYLGNIPRYKNEYDIKQYFSFFGHVESVEVVRKNQQNVARNSYQYGFVTFSEPQDAARALRPKIYKGLSKRLKVKPADTWRQPKNAQKCFNNSKPVGNDCEGSEGNNSQANYTLNSLLRLNDDCLCHIFSFLTQNEVLKLSFVCKRFYNIIEHIIKTSKFIDFDEIWRNFTLMETRQMLSAFGEHIRRLRLQYADNKCRRFIEFLGMFCHNLEEIDFRFHRDIHFDTYKRIFRSCKNLRSLTLHDCELTGHIGPWITGLTELESLDLSGNPNITMRHLKSLNSLKRLNLSDCADIDEQNFIELCHAAKLKDLNIVGCCQLGDNALNALITTQTDLECLAMSNSLVAYNLELVDKMNSLKHVRIHRRGDVFFTSEVLCELSAPRQESLQSLELYNLSATENKVNRDRILQLKNLRKLCLVRDPCLNDEYLGKIVRSCRMLESLNIAGSSNLVTEKGLLDAIENLQNLKFLNISHCDQFEYRTFHGICTILAKRKNKMQQPLTLGIYGFQFESENWEFATDPQTRGLIRFSHKEDVLCRDYCDDGMDLNYDDLSDVFEYFDSESDFDEYSYDSGEIIDYPEEFIDYPEAIFLL